MNYKYLKLPFIEVDEITISEVSKKAEQDGINLVNNGNRLELWNILCGKPENTFQIFGNIPFQSLVDIPIHIHDYIPIPPPISQIEVIPTRNGCSEWVSSKTLLEIVKTLVNGNSKGNDHPNDERTR